MRKLSVFFAAAIVSVGAEAVTYNLSSTITDSNSYAGALIGTGQTDLALNGSVDITLDGMGGYTVNGGTAVHTGSYHSALVLSAGDPASVIDIDAVNFAGQVQGNGVVFDSGALMTYVDGSLVGVIDPADDINDDPVAFTSDAMYPVPPFGAFPVGGIPMESGVINPDGTITITLPGIPGAVTGAGDFLQAVGFANVLGTNSAIFWEGTLTLTPTAVPVPAAAWLFGSALLGLAGVGRKRGMK